MRRRRRTHKRLPQTAGRFTVDIVYHDPAYVEALSDAVILAGGQVDRCTQYAEFSSEGRSPDFVLLNLEPAISRHPDLLEILNELIPYTRHRRLDSCRDIAYKLQSLKNNVPR